MGPFDSSGVTGLGGPVIEGQANTSIVSRISRNRPLQAARRLLALAYSAPLDSWSKAVRSCTRAVTSAAAIAAAATSRDRSIFASCMFKVFIMRFPGLSPEPVSVLARCRRTEREEFPSSPRGCCAKCKTAVSCEGALTAAGATRSLPLAGFPWSLRLAGQRPCDRSRADESGLPGRHAADSRTRPFGKHGKSRASATAVAKAGLSARSGHRIIQDPADPALTEEGPSGAAAPGPPGLDVRGGGGADAHSP